MIFVHLISTAEVDLNFPSLQPIFLEICSWQQLWFHLSILFSPFLDDPINNKVRTTYRQTCKQRDTYVVKNVSSKISKWQTDYNQLTPLHFTEQPSCKKLPFSSGGYLSSHLAEPTVYFCSIFRRIIIASRAFLSSFLCFCYWNRTVKDT
jgi:hypothetical protein